MLESNDRAAKNLEIVEALRSAFASLVERLTPEVEPATTYVLFEHGREPDLDSQQNK